MFIGRRADGTVYGAWTMKQPVDADHPNVEEVTEYHLDYIAFRDRNKDIVKIDPVQEKLDELETQLDPMAEKLLELETRLASLETKQ